MRETNLPTKSYKTKVFWQWGVVIGLVGLILLWFGQPSFAQGLLIEPVQVVPSIDRPRVMEPQELEAFLDKFFAQKMAELHIPGVAIAVVKDGKSFFTKGYGYADLERKILVDPNKTLFRLASVSKLFATTAVMQLAEQDKINLHDDVNQYLASFQLQESYPAPVTFDNLLTHTAGFDEKFIGIAAPKVSEILPLGDYLAKQMPARVMPPGKVISYSNHGIALLGYLVEELCNVPFAQYVDEHILRALNMHRSSFSQPLPPQLAPDIAVGYKYKQGRYQPLPSYYVNDGPAGALKATATDISHFMIAHLENGRYGQVKILEEKTAQQMHALHFTNHPRLPGWAYGFSERFQNNLRAIEHGGTDPGFASLLFLLPEQQVGLFVAYNNEQDELREQLISQFLDRYYPVQQPKASPQPRIAIQKRANYFVGSYRYIRYPHSTIEKLGPVLLQAPTSAPELRIKVGGKGILALEPSNYRSDRSPRRALKKVDPLLETAISKPQAVAKGDKTSALKQNTLVEIEPLLFQLSSGTYIAFEEDNHGKIAYMFIGADAFEKLDWYETNTWQFSLLTICVVTFSLCLISQSKRYPSNFTQEPHWHLLRPKHKIQSLLMALGSTLPVIISALNLSFSIGVLLIVLSSNLYEFAYRLPLTIIILLYIPIVAAGLTIVLSIFVALTWRSKSFSTMERLNRLLIVIVSWGFLLFLSYWNLLGFKF